MSTIDQRVVEMQFDNKNFERNVSTTMATLDKLKQSLNLSGASKGLENVDAAAKRVDLSGLSGAVETVGLKFNGLYSIADQALRNITTSAMTAGKNIASALTIEPIKAGFSEYETQMNAVQTILANTSHAGTDLQDVTAALDELNEYADKTIYNFTEMTRNVGTFTAAGLGLKESTEAIKGIANLAAASGSTSTQASTAMYQLSQALANGKVNLQDWNSVVNAGMGGKVFQDALVRTAAAMQGVSEETFRANNITGSFRESISNKDGTGWLSAEVLSNTLRQFTGDLSDAELAAQGFTKQQIADIQAMAKTANEAATKVKTVTQLWDTLKESAQSGWTQSWEIMVGDFEEAKEFLTKVSDVVGGMIGESAKARNELLTGGLSSGWKQLLSAGIVDEGSFQESIRKVVESHDVGLDEMIEKEGSFEKALVAGLTEGTITSDMLSTSIYNLASDMNKLSDEELEAAGYTKNHVREINELVAGLQSGSVSMEEFTEKMMKPSGRENVIEALWNTFEGLMSVITPIKDAFREIFPPMTADQLYKITENLKNFTEKLTLSENASENLKRTFKGVFAIFDIVKQAISAVFNALSPLLGGLDDLGGGVLETTASWGDWLVNLSNVIRETDIFNKVAQKIVGVIKTIVATVKSFVNTIKEKINFPGFAVFHEFLNKIHARMTDVGEAAGGMGSVVGTAIKVMGDALANSKFLQMFQALWNGVKTLGVGLAKAFGSIADGLVDGVANLNYDGLFDFFNTAAFGGIAIAISKFFNSVSEPFDGIKSMLEGVTGVLDGVKGSLEAWQTSLKADTLMKIAGAIGILALAIIAISLIDSEKLSDSLGAITLLFAELMGSMAVFGKISGTFGGVTKACAALYTISVSVLVLAAALKIMSTMSWEEMGVALVSMTVGLGALVGAINLLPKNTAIKTAGVFGLAVSMVVLAAAMKIMASMSWEEMGIALISLAGGLTAIVAAVNLLPKSTAIKTAGIFGLTVAMVVLGAALKIMSTMSWEEMGIALISLAGGLTAIVAAVNLLPKDTALKTAGIFGLATAMVVLGAALKIMASMSWEEMGVALISLAGGLVALVGAVNLLPKDAAIRSAGMIGLAVAMVIIGEALTSMSDMSWEEVARGLVAFGGSIAILAIGLNAMNGTLAGSAAMLVAATAIAVLAPALQGLGSMSWEEIGKGLVTLAGAFVVMGLAGLVLKPLVTTILGLSAAFALIGVGVLAIGAGLTAAGVGLGLLAIGFSALATSVASGATAIVAGLTVIITGLASLIPVVIAKFGEGIVALCVVVAEGAPAIAEAIKALVLSCIDVLTECVPAIAEGTLSLISELLSSLVEYTPTIVESLFNFVIAVIEALATKLPGLIKAVVDVFMALFQGVIEALKSIDPETLVSGIGAIGVISAAMIALAALASLAPAAMVGVLGVGAVITELGLVLAAIGALAQIPGLEWLVSEGGNFMQTIGTAIGQFVGGIVGGVAQGVTSSLPQMGSDLTAFMSNANGFIEGAKGIDSAAIEGVHSLVGVILALTAADLLEGLTSWLTGGSSFAKFGEEIAAFGPHLAAFADSTSGIDPEQVKTAANAAKALAEMTSYIPNEGGVAAWFAGENSISKFGQDLAGLGVGLKNFATETAGINSENVVAAAGAAKALAEMTAIIPNEGGVIGWFAGENSISKFGEDLAVLGTGLNNFANNSNGVDPEKVKAAADAAKVLAEMTAIIPNEGGVTAWFAGENSISKFSQDLAGLGIGLRNFATETAGVVPENITAAAGAAKALAEMTAIIPNEGGMVAWFTGENSLSKFSQDLAGLGIGLRNFAQETAGIAPENITAAANAAKALAEMTAIIPNEGGMAAWFTGENSMTAFADKLPTLGAGLKGFTESVGDMNPVKITSSANAAKTLVELAKTIPETTGNLKSFGTDIEAFGKSLSNYANSVSGVTSTTGADGVIASIKSIMFINSDKLQNISIALDDLIASLKRLSLVPASVASGFTKALTEVGKASADSFVKSFDGLDDKLKTIGQKAIDAFVKGVSSKSTNVKNSGRDTLTKFADGLKSQTSKAKTEATSVAKKCAEAIEYKRPLFKTAGKRLVEGFADGISANTFKAKAEAVAMANAALKAAEDALDIHSPSRKGYRIGNFFGMGFVNALGDYASKAYDSSYDMADSARYGLTSVLSNLKSIIDSDMDVQPTIRPVLDLSDVKSGVGAIDGMFGINPSIGVLNRVNSITPMMNRGQNGASNDDVVSAINELGAKISGSSGDSYNVNGITYDDGSNISNAVKTLVRAARVERRI